MRTRFASVAWTDDRANLKVPGGHPTNYRAAPRKVPLARSVMPKGPRGVAMPLCGPNYFRSPHLGNKVGVNPRTGGRYAHRARPYSVHSTTHEKFKPKHWPLPR